VIALVGPEKVRQLMDKGKAGAVAKEDLVR